MTKQDLKALADKTGLEIFRHPITREYMYLFVDSKELIPELDKLITREYHRVMVDRTLFVDTYRYYVYAPKAWFDLWGWTD